MNLSSATREISEAALDGTDYRSWDDVGKAFLNAVSYRRDGQEARNSETSKEMVEENTEDRCGRGTRVGLLPP